MLLIGLILTVTAINPDCRSKSLFIKSSQVYPYTLMTLPYDEDFLYPFISETIVYIHYTHHHNTYVSKLNDYVQGKPTLQDKTLTELVYYEASNDTTLQKHAGGDYNHNMYWYVLTSPYCQKKTQPDGELLNKINQTWGSFDNFVDQYSQIQKKFFGSGFAWVCVNQTGGLEIRTTTNNLNPLMGVNQDVCYPFLGNDLWEHAYYLLYIWDKADYINNFFAAIDWNVVQQFYTNYASNSIPIPF
jgi:superoxide dismutase, Fe-Mn family